MNFAAQAIIKCLENENMTQSQLAVLLGEDVRGVNQQIRRQHDMKVERFIDVLEHIGYRIEIVRDDGIRKVCREYADDVIKNQRPCGMLWTETENGYRGIYGSEDGICSEEFDDKEKCMKWLIQKKFGADGCWRRSL